ncbi:DUF2690 domain-containing protein [Kitasatospora sp. NPDC087314]|uniref:DUF2690 domain-containing protein n=1 Tax=Kitasatospora sp. NPDC087314 TaxID=3364068 RepID=UPI0038195746
MASPTLRTSALALAALAVLAPSAASPASASVSAPASASAAGGCRGNACDGKNPKALGCGNDARDVPDTQVAPGSQKHPRAWLRYSPTCHAVWAKGEQADGWTIRVQIMGSDSYDAPTLASGEAFTAMVGADHTHRVGVQDVDGRWAYSNWRHGG